MKNTLIKVKASKIDSRKHENHTHKIEGPKKRQFQKLTEIEVRMQPEVRYSQQ